MKTLVTGLILDSNDLSDWFEVKPKTFLRTKKEKLEELSCFCEYEVITSEKGYFKAVRIHEVYTPTYSRRVNPLKKDFLNWLDKGGIEEVASQTPDKVYSYTTVVNYYCATHDIPYNGPHYENILQNGTGDDGYRLRDGKRKTVNEEFHEWHYLYRLLRKRQMALGIKLGDKINCCAVDFNPTSLRKETSADRELQNKIYQKYFGKLSYQDLCDLMDTVSDMVDRGEITERDKDEIVDNKIMRTLSDKVKRRRAATECALAGVLRREGREYGEEYSIVKTEGVVFEPCIGDFDF